MQKLSPHYRDDPAAGIDPAIRESLDENYLRHVAHLDHANRKLLVVFSGGNAVGKTTISRLIADRFAGLVLENDGVKRHLAQLIGSGDRDRLNSLTWQYTMELYGRLPALTPNGLVVRDGVIDWYYDRILPRFVDAGYPLFIIGFDISRAKAIERIKTRGDTPTVREARFYELLDDHDIHIRRFRNEYTPDVLLTDETLFDHGRVLDALDHKLAAL